MLDDDISKAIILASTNLDDYFSSFASSSNTVYQILDNNIESLGLLLNSMSLSSNFTTGDPELDSLFQDDLIPELYSVLDGF
ncbi:SX2_G0043560.mRNA.1.CDS.1 [Saccharomyces cerevisiae]|nr:SX2_G0043560.mRNA.1.CDS.1 [Saccharomyces cerevisiae]